MKDKSFPDDDSLIHYEKKMNLKDILNMTMWFSMLCGILSVLGYILLLFE